MHFISNEVYEGLPESAKADYKYHFRISWLAFRNNQWQEESESVWFKDWNITEYIIKWPKHFRKGKFTYKQLCYNWVNRPPDPPRSKTNLMAALTIATLPYCYPIHGAFPYYK